MYCQSQDYIKKSKSLDPRIISLFNLDQCRTQVVGANHISLDPELSSPPQRLLFYCPHRTHFTIDLSTLADPSSTQLPS